MSSKPPIGAVIGLPPEETVRAFDARDQFRITNRWSEMWHEDHARAFTVARIAKLDLLATIRGSLDKVLRDGGTFEQWQAGLRPELERAGWWGRVSDRDLTGADHDIIVGSRRLRTIYDTNLRMSRAAGQWQRIQALKGERPFLRYSAVMDRRTRPAHRAWHGTILPVDHPWWDTHFPPCGWRCRCNVRQLSQADLDRNGWVVTPEPPAGPPRRFWPAGSPTPVFVPAGVDPGFAYNPGKVAMAPIADKLARTVADIAATDAPGAREALRQTAVPELVEQLLQETDAGLPLVVLDVEQASALGVRDRVVRMRYSEIATAAAAADTTPAALARTLAHLPEAAETVMVSSGGLQFIMPDGLTATVTIQDGGLRFAAAEALLPADTARRIASATVLRDRLFTPPAQAAAELADLPSGTPATRRIGRAGTESVDEVRGFERLFTAAAVEQALAGRQLVPAGVDPRPITLADFARVPDLFARGRRSMRVQGDVRQQWWTFRWEAVFFIYVEEIDVSGAVLLLRAFYIADQLPEKADQDTDGGEQ